MVHLMRTLVWITEDSWQATIAAAAELVPHDARVTLIHVTSGDAEALARGARSGLLGRGHHPDSPPEQLRVISETAARTLLADAAALFGRSAEQISLRGRAEHEVVAAAQLVDLLVLARDGDPARPGPKSIGHAARFVLHHTTCHVLLV
jgi:nucleotide-binding universal stress UspA family protein